MEFQGLKPLFIGLHMSRLKLRPTTTQPTTTQPQGHSPQGRAEQGHITRSLVEEDLRTWQVADLRSNLVLGGLPLVGSAFEERDGSENCNGGKRSYGVCSARRKVADRQCQQSGDSSESIHAQNGASLAAEEIRKAMRGVVLPRGRERNEAPARPGNGNQRRIEDCRSQDKQRDQPCGGVAA